MSRAPLVVAVLVLVLLARRSAWSQEGVFLSEADAPRAVLHEADAFERSEVPVTPELRERVAHELGSAPSMWEERWIVFRATHDGAPAGRAVIVEEIGKHRPITFVVGVRPDGTIADVAVMAYREAYGGEIQSTRFLVQYRGKRPRDDIRPYHGIQNVAGATLSVEAASRAVRKAQAIAAVLETPAS